MSKKHVKLTNGTSADASLVKAVALADDTFRVFLKNASGDTLCSIKCEDLEAAHAEIELINQQLGL